MKKILDCTFRDGGYLCNWDWDIDFVKSNLDLILSDKPGYYKADICEIGYRVPWVPPDLNPVRIVNMFNTCRDEILTPKLGHHKSKLCVMIDLKDFYSNESIDMFALKQSFDTCNNSVFDYVRIAINYSMLDESKKAVFFLWSLGYKVILSVMKVSKLTDCEINDVLFSTNNWPIEILYFADSYGALTVPVKFPASGNIKYGFHGHNNLGMALANSINGNSNYIDTTLWGIGRGAGNLDFLLYNMYEHKIFDVDQFKELYRLWHNNVVSSDLEIDGLLYKYSAVLNIHPKCAIEQIDSSELPTDKLINFQEKYLNGEYK